MDDDERYTIEDINWDIGCIKRLIAKLDDCLNDMRTADPRHTTPILKAEEQLQRVLNRLIDESNEGEIDE